MPYFKSRDEMLEIYRSFFDRIVSSPEIGPGLQKSRLVFRFEVHDPDGLIIVNCRDLPEEGRYLTYTLGESGVKPDITLSSSADFSHEFWQGKANVAAALLSGRVRAEGPVSQAVRLLPALRPLFELYPQVLKEMGREDLIIA